jgi:hypothetical protein
MGLPADSAFETVLAIPWIKKQKTLRVKLKQKKTLRVKHKQVELVYV